MQVHVQGMHMVQSITNVYCDVGVCLSAGYDEFPPRANSLGSRPLAMQRQSPLGGDTCGYMDMSPDTRASHGVLTPGGASGGAHLGDEAPMRLLRKSVRGNSPSVGSGLLAFEATTCI